MGYCDAHYQRLYLAKDVKEKRPIKQYAKRGDGIKLLKQRVEIDNPECMLWPYGQDNKGYGAVFYKGKRYKAHRLARIFFDGIENPPSDVFACHKCDNSLCINPRHIYWGDAESNCLDRFLYRI